MNVQHRTGETKGEFYIKKGDQVVANLTYSKADSTQMIIDHTEVSDDYRGEGLGKTLVESAVQFARDQQLKIIPLCSFAKATIEKDESLQDVVRK